MLKSVDVIDSVVLLQSLPVRAVELPQNHVTLRNTDDFGVE